MKMSEGGKPHDSTWRDLLTYNGLSGTTPVLEHYGLSCADRENDMSLLVQEDLIALGHKITQFHNRILRTWVHGLDTGVQHHTTDEKREMFQT